VRVVVVDGVETAPVTGADAQPASNNAVIPAKAGIQAFAELNAANLMFCEDAARRVAAVLSRDRRVERFDASVAHFESLHPHDAVARVAGRGPDA